jgi:hypothetical protein
LAHNLKPDLAEHKNHVLVEVELDKFVGLDVAGEPIVKNKGRKVLKLTNGEIGLLLGFFHLGSLVEWY